MGPVHKVPLAHLGLLVIIYLAFVSLGPPDGVLGVAWPAMGLDFQQALAAVGLLLLALLAVTETLNRLT